jgi:hypothetical protein
MISFCFERRRSLRRERCFGVATREAAFTTATVAAPATTPPAAAIATVLASSRRIETSPAVLAAGSGVAAGSSPSVSSAIASASSTSSATGSQATGAAGGCNLLPQETRKLLTDQAPKTESGKDAG